MLWGDDNEASSRASVWTISNDCRDLSEPDTGSGLFLATLAACDLGPGSLEDRRTVIRKMPSTKRQRQRYLAP